MADEFADHFTSKSHIDRVEKASMAALDRLKSVALNEENGLLLSMSEAMGQLYGIATYYKSLGLHRQGTMVLNDLAEFIKK